MYKEKEKIFTILKFLYLDATKLKKNERKRNIHIPHTIHLNLYIYNAFVLFSPLQCCGLYIFDFNLFRRVIY